MLQSPGHLLPFDESLADHLVDGRFDETRCNVLPVAEAVTAVHDEVPAVIQIDDELLELAEELGLLGNGLSVEIPVASIWCRLRAASTGISSSYTGHVRDGVVKRALLYPMHCGLQKRNTPARVSSGGGRLANGRIEGAPITWGTSSSPYFCEPSSTYPSRLVILAPSVNTSRLSVVALPPLV